MQRHGKVSRIKAKSQMTWHWGWNLFQPHTSSTYSKVVPLLATKVSWGAKPYTHSLRTRIRWRWMVSFQSRTL